MPRVRSDEMHSENNDEHEPAVAAATIVTTTKEKSPSPIGAGLPLLQRLRLLKEKQVSVCLHEIHNSSISAIQFAITKFI